MAAAADRAGPAAVGRVHRLAVAEIGYFTAFYAELLGAGGKPVIPEGTFVLASSLRLVTVAVLCGLVIREIWRPELDVVRQTYADDPDGGVFDGAPDAGWVSPLTAVAPAGAASLPPWSRTPPARTRGQVRPERRSRDWLVVALRGGSANMVGSGNVQSRIRPIGGLDEDEFAATRHMTAAADRREPSIR